MVKTYALSMFFLVSAGIGECFVPELLDSLSGEIHGGNFSYFNLQQPGFLSLELISHSGDCDLYISQFKMKPTFELDSYCLESSSCGLDSIIVPKSFKRPLAVGIYGHPSYEVSTYTLNIYEISETSDADIELDELYAATKYSDFKAYTEGSSSQEQSYFYYFITLIADFMKNLWNFLESIDRSHEFHPVIFNRLFEHDYSDTLKLLNCDS